MSRCQATAAGGAPQCDRVDGHTGSHAVYEEGKAFRWGVGLAIECLDALAIERARAERAEAERDAAEQLSTRSLHGEVDAENRLHDASLEIASLRKRLGKALKILEARHSGVGALAANEATRKAALDFIAEEHESAAFVTMHGAYPRPK